MNTRAKTTSSTPSSADAGVVSMDPQAARERAAADSAPPAPRLGDVVDVVVDEGVLLINNETGAPFTPGLPTPVTVTTTVLRRLQDQDFRLA